MVPLASTGAVCLQPSPDHLPTDLPPASFSNDGVGLVGVADLGILPGGFLSEPAGIEAGQASETRPAQILTDRQNSLTLCLYALLGLGLCRSAPFVKKLHLGCIPDWYHSGGPSQIGHSFAISPDCLTAAPVVCFIQPAGETEDVAPAYFSGAIAALLRKSQFTPTALASRGPPYMS
jgi:hypothetical protein